MKELAEAVATALPGTRVRINPAAAPDLRSYRVDFGLFRQLAPHHQPQHTLAATIAELHDKLARMGFHDSQFRSSGLMRLRVLTALREAGELTEQLAWAAPAGGAQAVNAHPGTATLASA